MFRRRRLPSELEEPLEAFRAILLPLERARSVLTEAVPTTRLPGRPFAEVLAEFESLLHEVEPAMAAWHVAELEREWSACSHGLHDALALAERVRLGATTPPEGFEGLIGTIGDLLAPLDAFAAAAERFRDLQRARAR
jgi:hypothetical protein